MKIQDFNATYVYVAEGRVFGNYWGGGKGSYKAKQFVSNVSKEDLIKTVNKALQDGSLDGGMGYESLIGACLDITTTTSIIIEDKGFHSEEVEEIDLGNMTEEEIEFTRYGYIENED